jgi:hypothetical protein
MPSNICLATFTSQGVVAYTAAMPSSKAMRIIWTLSLLALAANTARKVFQDPEAVPFFAAAVGAAVTVGAVGSCVALILVGLRRFSERKGPSPGAPRLLD